MAARLIRAVVVQEQYIIRRKPSPRPPQRGGGWLVACGIVGALFVVGKLAGSASNGMPAAPGRQVVIEARITDGNRCIVRGASVNGHGPFDLLADSGAPDMWFPVGDLPKLHIARSSLDFRPFGAREGNVAWVTLDTVRIGDFVARNVNAAIADGKEAHWRLLGMSVLKQGHMEIRGDICTLTFPRNAAALQ